MECEPEKTFCELYYVNGMHWNEILELDLIDGIQRARAKKNKMA